jgi:hypothetical protein
MIVRIIITFVLGPGLIVAAAPPATAHASAHIIVAQHESRQAIAPQRETPEERIQQWVRVGDLIGLRVFDDNDATIGFVRQVVRTPDGRIQLIVAHSGVLGLGGRLVAVSIEAVAIFGRQLASLDMKPEEYTWVHRSYRGTKKSPDRPDEALTRARERAYSCCPGAKSCSAELSFQAGEVFQSGGVETVLDVESLGGSV